MALDGEHDLSTAEELLALLADAKPHARGHLVVDLSKVTFIDASCIGVLMQVRSELAMQGRTLLVRSPSTTARRVLDLCDLGFLVETPPRPLPSVGGVAMTGPGREPHGCS